MSMTATPTRLPVTAGPRLRLVVRIVGSVVAATALIGALFNAFNTIAFEDFADKATFSAAELSEVETVVVRNTAGHSEVRVGSDDDVRLATTGTEGLFGLDRANRVSGDQLLLESSCPASFATHCRVDQVVAVPNHLAVDVRGRHGDVRVSGVSQPVNVDSRFGRIELADLSGPVRVRHGFGVIEAHGLSAPSVDVISQFGETTLVFTGVPGDVRVDTRFGQTVIELPDDGTTYRVTGETQFGDRVIEVRTDPASDQVLHVDHQFGDVIIRYTR